MIKRILVPTDGSDEALIGLHYAIQLAQKTEATIHGIHVMDVKLLEGPFLRDLSASLGTAPYVNYENNIALILEERGRAALEGLRDECEKAAVGCETTLQSGVVHTTIVEAAELVDLVVLGRSGEHTQWLDGLIGSTTEAVVRRTTAPAIVTGTSEFKLERVLAAYDGSQHAKRALQVCAELVEIFSLALEVLVVSEKYAETLIAEAKAYLDTHQVQTGYVSKAGDPSEEIIEYTREFGADLLVMGAYGHTKVRELVVGSTTSYAMNHTPCPILLTR